MAVDITGAGGGDGDFGVGAPTIDHGEVLLAVRRVLSEYLSLDIDDVRPEMRLFELPDVDSMKLLVMLLRFEREFGVQFEVEPATATKTVAELGEIAVQALRGFD